MFVFGLSCDISHYSALYPKALYFVLDICSFQQAEDDCSKALSHDKKVSGRATCARCFMQNNFFIFPWCYFFNFVAIGCITTNLVLLFLYD